MPVKGSELNKNFLRKLKLANDKQIIFPRKSKEFTKVKTIRRGLIKTSLPSL